MVTISTSKREEEDQRTIMMEGITSVRHVGSAIYPILLFIPMLKTNTT
jgi:hypothetical protein